ncbi:uncharacterized protein CC84DRAFT_1070139, partial [Paraphaeosphaeria sporulosa]
FNSKNKIIYAKLDTIFTTIECLGNCIASAVSANSPHIGACFGAVAVRIKSALDDSAHYYRIMEMFEVMGV